mgnify:CR=1 FL=1
MAQGYAVLANGGRAVTPYVIDAIYGPEGELLYRSEPAIACRECEPADDTGRGPGLTLRVSGAGDAVVLSTSSSIDTSRFDYTVALISPVLSALTKIPWFCRRMILGSSE